MTSTRRTFRTSWAAKALFLLGLFGFVAGWANACIVESPQQQQAGAYEQAAQGHAQHRSGDAGLHECNAALEDCASPCDKQQGPIPTPESPRMPDGTAWPAAIHAIAAVWAIDRVAALEHPQTRTSPPGVSVLLGFLRLTL